jgi:hypothetical protein
MKTPLKSLRFVPSLIACLALAPAALAVTFTNDTLISPTNTSYEGQPIVVTNCTLTVDGHHTFASLHLLNSGTLTHPTNSSVNLLLTSNLEIEVGAAIVATGKGLAGGLGAGAGGSRSTNSPYYFVAGAGGGYGGYGGLSSTLAPGGACYGSMTLPVDPGSGGGAGSGAGGAGGGLISITGASLLRVDGQIVANGANGVAPHSGGGSGGGIWLSVGTLSGAGSISANGGAGEPPDGGGGGGGRIAIQYGTNVFAGTLSAYGGPGTMSGGAGTIYTRSTLYGAVGQVVIDNGGLSGTNTLFAPSGPVGLTIGGGAIVQPFVPVIYVQQSAQNMASLLILSNGWLTLPNLVAFTLNVTGDATIQPGGGILGDGQGNPSGQGTGHGNTAANGAAGYTGSGGGYGGPGGASITNTAGGLSYGDFAHPTSFGSGGGTGFYPSTSPGGAGGGALQMSVTGTLTVNGTISANGQSGAGEGSGAGSGGGIGLTVGKLAGTGTITANGGVGDSPFGGGGGGGRIAINYATNAFVGKVSATGGPGASYGSAGTIYWKANTSSIAQLVVDNGGFIGWSNTAVSSSAGLMDLTVSGGAIVNPTGTPTLNSFLVASNSWLAGGSGSLGLVVNSNATIQAGGGVLLDGKGSLPGQGSGAGRSYSSNNGITGGGGGYGGYGGNSSAGASGGTTYGSITAPESAGSGGGSGYGVTTNNVGGAGGGALQLTVNGTLTLDGKLSVNGTRGIGQGSGGGSGGSVWLTVGRLAGAGLISANGGPGDLPYGGGGGGGRIAIVYTTNQFAGSIQARGGAGANYGGAGTVYFKANNKAITQIIVDNGGLVGGSTPWATTVPGPYDLTITGGAVLSVTYYNYLNSINNLLITTNSWLAYSNTSGYYSYALTVTSNATIQAGGGIFFDGRGYGPGLGTGPGGTYSGSYGISGGGGGHGGYGSASAYGATGGNSYGSISSPTSAGSGGGNGYGISTNNQGGYGGGALQMTVSGVLTLNGQITANGTGGIGQSSGGGAGGAIYLTVGTLTGAGLLAANGGPGDLPYGGGGGGGRIAVVYSKTNQFAGTMSARGGAGATYGGAGTIYLSITQGRLGGTQLILDNGGVRGTNTPLSLTSDGFDLTIGGGAVAVPASGSLPTQVGYGLNLRNLLISSNGWLSQGFTDSKANLKLSLSGSATIQAGGGIDLVGKGYTTGPGAGGLSLLQTYGYIGGGGGYGGSGGSGVANASGGAAYGSVVQPVDGGSGGGAFSTLLYGAPGGGAIQITTKGSLVLDGIISVDGSPAVSEGSGGGSGGSVWLSVNQFSGAGVISANGGSGDVPQGGGGGGGRIALYYTSNAFTGTISARGGAGTVFGGAGTIYSYKSASNAGAQLTLDNGGAVGTNTPLAGFANVNLTVTGGAVASAVSNLVLNTLLVDSGSAFAQLSTQTNLDLMVYGDARIRTNAVIVADGEGYNGSYGGPGAGRMLPSPYGSSSGSGGGYGGAGGGSLSGSPGGSTYGSAAQPTDRGSRGGLFPVLPNFCQGGGAIRLKVAGTLTLDGRLSANGNSSLFESAGGGAGGSIWVTARKLTGTGAITAIGGEGDLLEGGGGGGGRIALYCGTNDFAGLLSAAGGDGASPGGNGTVLQTDLPAVQVIAQSPEDLVSSVVSSVDLTFSSPLDVSSGLSTTVLVDTPSGSLPSGSVGVAVLNSTMLRISFPSQTNLGYYDFEISVANPDIYGALMPAPYFGSFIIWPASISGRVTDTNGLPVAYVTLRLDGQLLPAITDTNGLYSVEVPPSWTGTVTPSKGPWKFIPSSRTYTNLSQNATDQNFVMVASTAFSLTQQSQGTNMNLQWFGLNGVSYEAVASTNLLDWWPCADPMLGSNGPCSLTLPIGSEPIKFFRVRTTY